MTQEADGSYFGCKHLEQTILIYLHFIENGQAKLRQHYAKVHCSDSSPLGKIHFGLPPNMTY